MFSSAVRTTASRFAARAAVGTSSRAAVQPSMIAVRSFASVSCMCFTIDIVCTVCMILEWSLICAIYTVFRRFGVYQQARCMIEIQEFPLLTQPHIMCTFSFIYLFFALYLHTYKSIHQILHTFQNKTYQLIDIPTTSRSTRASIISN